MTITTHMCRATSGRRGRRRAATTSWPKRSSASWPSTGSSSVRRRAVGRVRAAALRAAGQAGRAGPRHHQAPGPREQGRSSAASSEPPATPIDQLLSPSAASPPPSRATGSPTTTRWPSCGSSSRWRARSGGDRRSEPPHLPAATVATGSRPWCCPCSASPSRWRPSRSHPASGCSRGRRSRRSARSSPRSPTWSPPPSCGRSPTPSTRGPGPSPSPLLIWGAARPGHRIEPDRALLSRLTIDFLRPIPSVALIPILVLVYGTRPSLKVTAFGATFPLLFQAMYGVADVDRGQGHGPPSAWVGAPGGIVLPSCAPTSPPACASRRRWR